MGEALEYFQRLKNLPFLDWSIQEVFENFWLSDPKVFPFVELLWPETGLFPFCLGGEVRTGRFVEDHAMLMISELGFRLGLEFEHEALSIYFARTWPVFLADLCFFGTIP